jgi:Ssp1 endopeptidase immunity protein Rap1a
VIAGKAITMTKTTSLTLLALTINLAVGHAKADPAYAFYDGNGLLAKCRANLGFCNGYVAGIADAVEFSLFSLGKNNRWFCLPEKVATQQNTEVVINYLSRYPEARHYAAPDLVTRALGKAFPCNTAKSGG